MSADTIFIIGCIFPALSWLTFVGTFINKKLTGKYTSPVFISIIGPVILNIWSLELHHPVWTLVLPWLLDIGTVSFFIVLPKLLGELWQYSKYTELFSLVAEIENQNIKMSFHKNNHFIIRYNWKRNKGESGIISMNDFGFYEQSSDSGYVLTSHTGKIRELKIINAEYHCTDKESEGDSKIDGYVFT